MPAGTRPPTAGEWPAALAMAAILAVTVAAVLAGTSFTTPQTSDPGSWYAGLSKPPLYPPGWVFGAVWTPLYAMMAVACWRAWRASRGAPARSQVLAAYGIQLGFNIGWTAAFFGLKSPSLGLAVIAGLAIAVATAAWIFFARDRIAGWLMVPYLGWIGFAAYLNVGIAVLNA